MVTAKGLRQLTESSARIAGDRVVIAFKPDGLYVAFAAGPLIVVSWELLEDFSDEQLAAHLIARVEKLTSSLASSH